MAHIRKHPITGKAQVRYRDPSGKECSKTFVRSSDARAYKSQIEHSIARGAYIDRSLSKTAFCEVAALWLAGKVGLRRSSWVRDESYLRRHVVSFFGSYEVGVDHELMIEQWVRGLCSVGLSAGTVRQCFRILRCVLDDAVDRGLISSSPCKRIGLPRVVGASPLFLGPSEVAGLASCIEPRFSALVLTAAYLGLRWGELAGLLRTGLDFSGGAGSPAVVRVVGTLEEVAGIVRYVSETKSRGGRRSLTIPPFLVSELSSHLSSFGPPASLVPLLVDAPSVPGGSLPSSSFVFTDVDGGVLRGSRFRRRYWKPAVLAAGLDPSLRFHDLRHTCASLLIAQGAHPKEIQARLGHASIKTTLDTYGHLLPNLGARLDEGLESMFRESHEDRQFGPGNVIPPP